VNASRKSQSGEKKKKKKKKRTDASPRAKEKEKEEGLSKRFSKFRMIVGGKKERPCGFWGKGGGEKEETKAQTGPLDVRRGEKGKKKKKG